MENQNEIWKDVPGYEGLYQVSNFGNVRAIPKKTNNQFSYKTERKFTPDKNGLLRVTLIKDNIRKTFFVHFLVADAFLDNPKDLSMVSHINGNITDNREVNLSWKEGIRYGVTIDNDEEWRDILGYEGIYQVSNFSRVKVLPRVKVGRGGMEMKMKERVFSSSLRVNKYENIGLVKDGQRKNAKVHRLVAVAFIPNPDNKPIVNHINGIKSDNRIENLEWCTELENSTHAWDTGLSQPQAGEINPMSKLTENQVLEIRSRYEENQDLNKNELAKEFGLSLTGLRHIINKTRWQNI